MFRSLHRSIFLKPLLAALLLGPCVGAQPVSATPAPQWTIGNGTMSFLGCAATPSGVQCDVVYTLVKVPAGLLALQADDLSYTAADGKSGDGKSVSIAGGPFAESAQQDSVNGEPIRATFQLPLPASTTSLRTLEIVGHRLDNVVVARTAAALGAATPPDASMSATISGSVRTAGDLHGALVIACIRQGDGCAPNTIKYTEITGRGAEAPYTISGLDRARSYAVFAWRDVDGNGEINAGDLLGSFDTGVKGTSVAPPRTGTDFTLTKLN